MVDNVKKRYSLSEKLLTHLFEGEVSGNSFGGLHSEAVKSVDNGKVQVHGGWPDGQRERREAGKSYWANVKVNIDGTWYGPGLCSFFPLPRYNRAFDRDTLIRMIEQTLTAPADTIRSHKEEWITNPRKIRGGPTIGAQLQYVRVKGLRCRIQYQGGTLASIYPIVP